MHKFFWGTLPSERIKKLQNKKKIAVVDFCFAHVKSHQIVQTQQKRTISAKSKSAENFICSQPDLGQDISCFKKKKIGPVLYLTKGPF